MTFPILMHLSVTLIALWSVVASAESAVAPLASTGHWTLDYGADACTLSRSFGDPAKPVTFYVMPFPMGKSVKIAVISPGPSTNSQYSMGEVRFGGAPLVAFFRTVPLGQDRGTLRSMVVDQLPFFQGMTTQPVITIKFLKARTDLQIGPSASAVEALRLCESDLLAKWGMSVAAQTSVVISPQGGVSQFFKSSDYPDDALRTGRMGVTGVRFWVGLNGKLSDCRVIFSSGTESIDRRSCEVLESRGHLAPALDKANQPLRSLSSTQIVWALPDE